MNKSTFEEKNNEPVEQLSVMPKIPMHVEGYVIYSQVALDFKKRYKLGKERQTALNIAIAKAIIRGDLRSYDVGTGLPCGAGDFSSYVRPDDIEAWLKSIGYPLEWTGGTAAEDLNRGSGSEKKWVDAKVEKLIKRRHELKAQGITNWAAQAAAELGISTRLTRQVIHDYQERSEKLKDPAKWVKKR